MAIIKTNGFAAPYRSLTLRNGKRLSTGRSGLLEIFGPIVESSGIVTVPPVRFVQQGLLVENPDPRDVIIPLGLIEPYYLTVRSPSVVLSSDLIYGFAKSPTDISDDLVIVGEKANGQWRPYYDIDIDAVVKREERDRLDLGLARPLDGLRTTFLSPDFTLSAGVAVDKAGQKHRIEAPVTITRINEDADWPRVDRMVFRRPLDKYERIARVEQILGGTYSEGAQTAHKTAFINASLGVHQQTKAVSLVDNRVAIITMRGYGTTYQLIHTLYSDDRQSLLSAPTVSVVDNITRKDFDIAMLPNGELSIVYISEGRVRLQRINPETGALIGIPVSVDSNTQVCEKPSISILDNGQQVICYQQASGPTTFTIFFTKRNITGGALFPPVNLTNTPGSFTSPFVVCTDDYYCYLAYKTNDGNITLRTLNDIGQDFGPAVVVSEEVEHPVHGTLSGNATYPKIIVSGSKKITVSFLQEKPSSEKGIAFWTDGAATMIDLQDANEDIQDYNVLVTEPFNSRCVTFSLDTGIYFYKIEENNDITLSETLEVGLSSSVFNIRETFGSITHFWANNFSSSFVDYGSPVAVPVIGPVVISGTLGSFSISSSQFVVDSASAPNIGDQITIAGSSLGNNGPYIVSDISIETFDAPGDIAIISVTSTFAATEEDPLNVLAQYAEPAGNSVNFIKSVSDIKGRAFSNQEQNCDVLLARIIQPGDVVLNYIPNNEPQSDSDTLGIFGSVNISWEVVGPSIFQANGTLRILDFFNNVEYQIAGGDYPLNEGDALYVRLEDSNLTPSYEVAPLNEIPWEDPIQVMGFIKDGEFYPKFLIQADVGKLDSGEIITIGEDLPLPIRTRLGILQEDLFEPYTSAVYIDTPDSYPTAISKLDMAFASALASISANQYFEAVLAPSGGIPSGSFITLPLGQNYIVGSSQLKVFFDGVLKKPGLTREYVEVEDALSLGTTIQVLRDIPEDMEVMFAIIYPAATANQVSINVLENDVLKAPNVSAINFVGSVDVQQVIPGIANVTFTGSSGPGGGNLQTKRYRNGTPSALPPFTCLAFLDNGQVVPADANILSIADFAGITLETILPGQFGDVGKLGNIPGILTALGIQVTPGTILYLSGTPGEIATTAPVNPGDTILLLGQAEPPDGTAMGLFASDLWLNPQIISYQNI
jgi:hypothetical protein